MNVRGDHRGCREFNELSVRELRELRIKKAAESLDSDSDPKQYQGNLGISLEEMVGKRVLDIGGRMGGKFETAARAVGVDLVVFNARGPEDYSEYEVLQPIQFGKDGNILTSKPSQPMLSISKPSGEFLSEGRVKGLVQEVDLGERKFDYVLVDSVATYLPNYFDKL